MKHFYYCIFLLILSCKTTNSTINKTEVSTEISKCILTNLPKTVQYENKIESYTSIYNDTIFEIESFKKGMDEYSTKIELKSSERYVWLLKENEKGIDTLLIHCITPSKSVDSYFILKDCEIEIETAEYDDIGNPIASGSQKIKM